MGVRLMVEVLDNPTPELSDKERIALLAAAESFNDVTRSGWPGKKLIARRARISMRRAGDLLQRLVLKGVLSVLRKGGGRGKTTAYRMAQLAVGAHIPPTPPAPDRDRGNGDVPDASETPEAPASVDNPGAGPGKGDVHDVTLLPGNEANGLQVNGDGGVLKGDAGDANGDAGTSLPAQRPYNPQGTLKEPSSSPRERVRGRHRDENDLELAVIEALAQTTGVTVTADWAARVAHQILAHRTVAQPAAYCVASIARDPYPARFLPTVADLTVAEAMRHPAQGCDHGDPRGARYCAFCRHGIPAKAAA